MDAPRIQALQADLVRTVADNLDEVMEGEWGDREWLRLFVEY